MRVVLVCSHSSYLTAHPCRIFNIVQAVHPSAKVSGGNGPKATVGKVDDGKPSIKVTVVARTDPLFLEVTDIPIAELSIGGSRKHVRDVIAVSLYNELGINTGNDGSGVQLLDNGRPGMVTARYKLLPSQSFRNGRQVENLHKLKLGATFEMTLRCNGKRNKKDGRILKRKINLVKMDVPPPPPTRSTSPSITADELDASAPPLKALKPVSAIEPGFWSHPLASEQADRAESTPSPPGNINNEAMAPGSAGTLPTYSRTAVQWSNPETHEASGLLKAPPSVLDKPGQQKRVLVRQRLFESPMRTFVPPPPQPNYHHHRQPEPQAHYYASSIGNANFSGGHLAAPEQYYDAQHLAAPEQYPEQYFDPTGCYAPFSTAANMSMAPVNDQVYDPAPPYNEQAPVEYFQYPPPGIQHQAAAGSISPQQVILPNPELWVPPSPTSVSPAPGRLATTGRSMPQISSLRFGNCAMCGDANVQGMVGHQNVACFMCIPCWNVVTSRAGIKRTSATWTQGFRDKFKALHRLQSTEVSVTTANNRFTIQVSLLERFLIKFCEHQKIDLGSVGGDGGNDIQTIFTAMRLGRVAFLRSATFIEHIGAADVNDLIHDQQVVVKGGGALDLGAAAKHSITCVAICTVASASAMGLVEVP